MGKIETAGRLVLVSTTLLAAAACSAGGATGTAASTSAAAELSSSPAPTGEQAPPIPNPLDPAGLVKDPCRSLTVAQAADMGVQERGTKKEVGIDDIQGCDWKFGANLEWKIQVAYAVPYARNGVQNLYDQNAAGKFANGYFMPISISGYPGVFSGRADTRPHGRCDLSVGINPEMFVMVGVTGQRDKDNCKAASTVAERIISTIKSGGN
ncbi:DUF3558 domain-containing protein [Amycolatopsis viridis]|uniref:DUF3558 domain-containing protein n=1 Tax=Amycolatopsis viridis TaxID=185678 RepID=A0ABX0SN32_9PSEU|nr:DUF3558 domain-containing protein [Amycolatopsis viridis]NIH78379.1 hypothetical protein [Amycolatopsis viridis]